MELTPDAFNAIYKEKIRLVVEEMPLPAFLTEQSTLAAQIAGSPLRSLLGLLFALQFRMRNYTFTMVSKIGTKP